MIGLKSDKAMLLAAFGIAFVLLSVLSYFPKQMSVYPDEFRYLQITDGLFNHGHLMIRCTEASFTKVMYPLALFPAAWFSGTEYYTKTISVLNSFYMAFLPVLAILLGKACCLSRKKLIFLVALAFACPDLLYVMTFMSENLYIPLGVGTILLAWKLLAGDEDKRIFCLLPLLVGGAFYLLYLNKEVGAALPLAYVLTGIYMHMRGEGNRLPWKMVLLPFGVFCVLFLAVNSIFFSGLGNSYATQISFAKASFAESMAYFFEACLIHLDRTVFAFFVFPVIIPIAYWQGLDKTARYRYVFLTLCLLISLAAVSYTVTLYEDYPSLAPREHMRYVSFLFLPYVALALQALELGREKMRYTWLAAMVILFLVAQAVLKGNFNPGTHVDQMMLKYVLEHKNVFWEVTVALAVACYMFHRHERKAAALLAVLMLSVSLFNQGMIYKQFRQMYEVSADLSSAYVSMAQDMKDIKKDAVCIVSPNSFSGTSLLDCYPNSISVVSYRMFQDVWHIFPEYKGNLSISIFHDMKEKNHINNPYFRDFTPDNQSAHYLLVSPEAESEMDHARMRFIKKYENGFALYENDDNAEMPFIAK
ncbi:hypothetical protein [Selenomonas sp. KH1T6]|uniref:hypothetical protein n=1 Tax=Selenomonas sp. KH1T6 TaxID=3158784 RepID=UPI0008A7404F|nr:hypothetical protein SAMN05216583_106157 [Selenomonas ruminantium]